MNLSKLIYASKRNPNCTDEEIQKILESCKKNNPGKDITGILMHSDSKFIQYLEGDSKEILSLYDLIKTDDRHSNVVMLSYGPLPERLFPSWHMGYKEVNPDKLSFNTDISNDDLGVFNDLISGKEREDDKSIMALKNFFEKA